LGRERVTATATKATDRQGLQTQVWIRLAVLAAVVRTDADRDRRIDPRKLVELAGHDAVDDQLVVQLPLERRGAMYLPISGVIEP